MSTNIDVPPLPTDWSNEAEVQAYFATIDRLVKDNPDHPLLKGRLDGNPIQVRAPWKPDQKAWLDGVNGVGGQRWVAGIQNPRAEFKSAALRNNEGWKAGVQKAVAEDKFKKGMEGVDVEAAIETAVKIGASGYQAGAAARADKFQKNTDAIAAKMGAVVQGVRGMPAKTDADREARMLAMVRGAKKAAE